MKITEKLTWVPKEVLSPPMSAFTQQEGQEHTTKQPTGVQAKERWVWRPKHPQTTQSPQEIVKTNKMIWQKKEQVLMSNVKPLSLPTSLIIITNFTNKPITTGFKSN